MMDCHTVAMTQTIQRTSSAGPVDNAGLVHHCEVPAHAERSPCVYKFT